MDVARSRAVSPFPALRPLWLPLVPSVAATRGLARPLLPLVLAALPLLLQPRRVLVAKMGPRRRVRALLRVALRLFWTLRLPLLGVLLPLKARAVLRAPP